jgi:hypothetical protein
VVDDFLEDSALVGVEFVAEADRVGSSSWGDP